MVILKLYNVIMDLNLEVMSLINGVMRKESRSASRGQESQLIIVILKASTEHSETNAKIPIILKRSVMLEIKLKIGGLNIIQKDLKKD